MTTLFALLAFALPLNAQEAPKADEAPAASVETAKEAPKEAAKDAPPAVEAKAEPAPEPKPEPKPAVLESKRKFKNPETAAEWHFLKEAGSDSELSEALPQALQVFIRQHIDDPAAVDAKFLEAQLRDKYGDYKTALVDYLRVLHENPTGSVALQAKSAFLTLAEKKLGRKYKPVMSELVKASDKGGKAERLAAMLEKISTHVADAVYEPAIVEFNRFQIRYPDFDDMDDVVWNFGWLHERNEKHAAALLEFKRLIAVYQGSPRRPKAYAALAQIYADGLKNYQKSVGAYQDLVAQYPEDPGALDALEQTVVLFAEKLKQYELAVEIDEKIIAKYPKTPAAFKALRGAAQLLRDKLSRPAEAIAALKRVQEHAGSAETIAALQDAAQIARRDLKDYKTEVELRRKIAGDFATSKDAADQLYQAGEVSEGDLKDSAQAAAIYQEVQSKFAGTKPAKKAADRIARLEKK